MHLTSVVYSTYLYLLYTVAVLWYSIDILIVVITSLVDVHVLSLAELSDDLNAEDIVRED